MIYKKTINAQLFIKFFERLIKDAGRKIYLILDNLQVHHSKIVKSWVEEHKDQYEIILWTQRKINVCCQIAMPAYGSKKGGMARRGLHFPVIP
jgi:hypothetical protein